MSEDFKAGEEFPFLEELFETPTRTKTRLTKAEKRRRCQQWRSTNATTATQMKKEQERDPDIQRWLEQEDPSRIKHTEGILCHLWRPRNSPSESYEQIVLPKRYHQQVMKIAHALPFAGHLGREKTALRILRRFYWPTLFQDVRQYCQTCEECQLHGRSRMKAPMIPLPVIGEPFKRIALDIVGPLPRTRKGNHFILVLSDYAT